MASQTAEHSLPPNEGGKEPVEIAWAGRWSFRGRDAGKGCEGIFWNDGSTLHLDKGLDYAGVCQNSRVGTFEMCFIVF